MSVQIKTRAEWGAKPPTSRLTVPITSRTEFFVHYTGNPPDKRAYADPASLIRSFQTYDQGPARKWNDIGYNFLVDLNGQAWEGRGRDVIGAHCPNHNTSGIGVQVMCGVGEQPTDAALRTVRDLYEMFSTQAGRRLAMKGHRDGKNTSCPGDPLYAWVKAGMPYPEQASKPAPKPTDPRRYQMLLFVDGRDVALAGLPLHARRGVVTSDPAEAKAAVARGEQVIAVGGTACAALGWTWAEAGKTTSRGSLTAVNGRDGDQTRSLAEAVLK